MKTFTDFSNFLIEIPYQPCEGDYLKYKSIFVSSEIDTEVDEELSTFIDMKIDTLEDGILKLALILKKYDFLSKPRKNGYLRDIQEKILNIFFDAYREEEYVYSINAFLPNFKPLIKKDFILEYYLENHENIGNPFGLIDTNFIVDANFDKDLLRRLIDLGLTINESINDRNDAINMEKIFDVCEKKQIQDLKTEAAKKIVDYLSSLAREKKDISRNFFIQRAFKYIDYCGEDRFSKKKELLNLVLENTNNVNSYFEANTRSQEFEIDQVLYNNILANFREVGVHQAFVDLSQKLFNLYDYESEKLSPTDMIYMISSTVAYDSSGLPIYTVNHEIFDDIFFHKKTTDIQLIAILFTRYIEYLRENSNFQVYISEFYLPESLSFIRDLDILNDFKNKNYFGFISQMIPIIESHFRYCLGLVNEPYIMPNGIGGYDYLPMRAFLESSIIREKLGINTVYILKLIFDDRRGLNYRNKLAHGILDPKSVTELEANLVFLTLIYMTYFEQKLCEDN